MLIPYSFCLISSVPLFDVHKSLLLKLYQNFLMKLTAESTKQPYKEKYTMEFYLSMAFHHLYYNPELHNDIEIVCSKPKTSLLMRFRNCRDSPFSLPNYSYKPLLGGNLTALCLADLVRVLMFERKLIIVCDNYGESALLTESLLVLIQPL